LTWKRVMKDLMTPLWKKDVDHVLENTFLKSVLYLGVGSEPAGKPGGKTKSKVLNR